MKEPKLDLYVDKNKDAILIVECPECGDKSRFVLNEVSSGSSILCNCGGILNIPEKSLEPVRQEYEEIKKTR